MEHENKNEIRMLKNTLSIKQTIIDELKMNDEKMEAQIHSLKNKVDGKLPKFIIPNQLNNWKKPLLVLL